MFCKQIKFSWKYFNFRISDNVFFCFEFLVSKDFFNWTQRFPKEFLTFVIFAEGLFIISQCVCVCVCVRERERRKARERGREREVHERMRERERERERERTLSQKNGRKKKCFQPNFLNLSTAICRRNIAPYPHYRHTLKGVKFERQENEKGSTMVMIHFRLHWSKKVAQRLSVN